MKTRQLWFAGPRQLEIREVELPEIGPDQVLVRTLHSAISAGTELLAYRGQLPAGIPLDSSLPALQDNNSDYPFQYGYASVGVIEKAGADCNEDLPGKRVFAFQPHASHFISRPEALIDLPDSISTGSAVFTANMETAVNLMIDGEADQKENVLIMGLGVVGQLLLSVLVEEGIHNIVCLDRLDGRRQVAGRHVGIYCLDPDDAALKKKLPEAGLDLIFELSGNPRALNQAIELCGFAGRIIVGSWYGNKEATLDLGGVFHRNRISIISSQVSTISPAHAKIWNKQTRLQKAMSLLEKIKPEQLITHRFEFSTIAIKEAYSLLDETPGDALQVIINYEE